MQPDAPSSPPLRLVGGHEIAEYLGVKPGTVYRWAQRQQIPCYRLGRCVRFDPDEVKRWALEQYQPPRGKA